MKLSEIQIKPAGFVSKYDLSDFNYVLHVIWIAWAGTISIVEQDDKLKT